MSHVIEELYFERVPTDLYRHGSKTNAQFHKVRTAPPRRNEERHDIKTYSLNGVTMVDADSGGISLFNLPDLSLGTLWWRLPRGAFIPDGLRVSRDRGVSRSGRIHYSIRPCHDMPLNHFVMMLESLARRAEPTFEQSARQVK